MQTLEEQGYLHIPALLPPDQVRDLQQAFSELLALAKTLPPTDPEGLHQAHFVRSWDPFKLHRVVWAGAASPMLAKLGDDPRFLAIAASVLGTSQMDQLIQQAHFKLPGDGVAFSWHQDASNRRYGSPLWSDTNGQGSFVQIAVAVDPMCPHNGGLQVLPGTHRLGFVADPETGEIPPEHLDLNAAVYLDMAPGDAALFGPFLIHGSGPNTGTTSRRLFLQGYACPGANRRRYPGSGLGLPRHLPQMLSPKLSEQ